MNVIDAAQLVMLAGGPGSGRHPGDTQLGNGWYTKTPRLDETDPKNPIMSWARHPQLGIIFQTNRKDTGGTHAEWFEQIGLPHSGRGYDAIQRGVITVYPFSKARSTKWAGKIRVSSTHGFAPKEVIERALPGIPKSAKMLVEDEPHVGG
jgi:hypothetical protein